MKIKKLVSMALVLAFMLLAVGCMPKQATPSKAQGEITVFAEESLKDMLMAAATAYTKPVRELPEREKLVILFTFCTAEELSQKLVNDDYADAVFALSESTLDAFDAAASGHDKLVHSSRTTYAKADGTVVYTAAIPIASDRQDVAKGFFDYIQSEEAAPVLAEFLGK